MIGHISAECWSVQGLGNSAKTVKGASFVDINSFNLLSHTCIQCNSLNCVCNDSDFDDFDRNSTCYLKIIQSSNSVINEKSEWVKKEKASARARARRLLKLCISTIKIILVNCIVCQKLQSCSYCTILNKYKLTGIQFNVGKTEAAKTYN